MIGSVPAIIPVTYLNVTIGSFDHMLYVDVTS